MNQDGRGGKDGEKLETEDRSFLHEHTHARPRDQAIALI